MSKYVPFCSPEPNAAQDFDGDVVRLGEAQATGTSSTPPFEVMLPQRPKRVLLNARHDILANDVQNIELP